MIAVLTLLFAWPAVPADPAESPRTESASPAAEAPEGDLVITDVFGNRERCNAGNARRVDFERLASGDGTLHGQCVAVSGYRWERALFVTRADSRIRYAQSADSLEGRRVGLYGLSSVLSDDAPRGGFYRVVGIVGDCDRLGGGGMMMGYCHYTSGPYLAVSELRRIR